MKHITKMLSAFLCLVMVLACMPAAFAATVPQATIDMDKRGSLTIWKYDKTNAMKDGKWSEDAFQSTGWRESYVEETLGGAIRHGDTDAVSDLGNGTQSMGYAIKGVEFTLLQVADIVTFTESVHDGHAPYNKTQVLYGFDKEKAADLLKAIGLENGKLRYENADDTDKLTHDKYYYLPDALNKALSDNLASNPTIVKDALETYIKNADNAIIMDKTDGNGKTIQRNLPVGLYLCIETAVPEMVTSTTNPFFVSLPMTTVTGDENSSSPQGGTQWNYDIVVYPKNETGIPTLETTIREAKVDTGKNNASNEIDDGFAHNATGSAGDLMEVQTITTLPTITSRATGLSTYKFYSTITDGLSYHKAGDVQLAFFTDAACTQESKVASWDQRSGMFTVTYSGDDRHMMVELTQEALDLVNGVANESASGAGNIHGEIYKGFSNYTARLTYTEKIHSDGSMVYGQDSNTDTMVLTWKRTSADYFDTLVDDVHVYSFGIDLTKLFSDKDPAAAESEDMYADVKLKIWNETDGYWVKATRNDSEGVYYVDGHVQKEADATVFYPVVSDGVPGKILVKGCEDDAYIITEVETANGYTLLKDDIHVVITSANDPSRPCDVYGQDILGVLQNDPHYDTDGGLDLKLANIPQKQLAHNLLTASATVDGNDVAMESDAGSLNALAPLTVVNAQGFDLPQTGDAGVWMYCTVGMIALAGALLTIAVILKKDKKEQQAD